MTSSVASGDKEDGDAVKAARSSAPQVVALEHETATVEPFGSTTVTT